MPRFLVVWIKSDLFFRQFALGLIVASVVIWGWSHIHMVWTPFAVGWSLAYVLNIPLTWISEKIGIPRWLGAFALVGILLLAVTAGIMLSFPLVQEKLAQLAFSLPGYAQLLAIKIEPLMERINDIVPLKPDWPQYVGGLGRELVQFVILCVSNSMVLANIFTLVVLTPIVTFYSLKDWPEWIAKGKEMIGSPFLRGLLGSVDHHIMAYIRGQASVCGILMCAYTLANLLLGIKGAPQLGILIGCAAFVPYGAVAFGITSMALMAFNQFGDSAPLIEIILMVGFLGAIEAYVLIPYFIGQRLGIHAVAVLFCFLMCIGTFGFTGVFIAMPLLASVWGAMRFTYDFCQDEKLQLTENPLNVS